MTDASWRDDDRCGNVASILELDENLNSTYQTFEAAAQVSTLLSRYHSLSIILMADESFLERVFSKTREEFQRKVQVYNISSRIIPSLPRPSFSHSLAAYLSEICLCSRREVTQSGILFVRRISLLCQFSLSHVAIVSLFLSSLLCPGCRRCNVSFRRIYVLQSCDLAFVRSPRA